MLDIRIPDHYDVIHIRRHFRQQKRYERSNRHGHLYSSVSFRIGYTEGVGGSVSGTFQIVKAFHLAERRLVPIRGIPTVCAVPTEEREETWGWSYKQTERGWFADCDFETLRLRCG